MYDLKLKNGLVYDGTGGEVQRADLGIKNGEIVSIGPKLEEQAEQIIDVKGNIVCPGFIDVHSHADLLPFVTKEIRNSRVYQGITTELVGQCGLGPAPFVEKMEAWQNYLYPILGGSDIQWQWPRFRDYLDALAQFSKPNNVAALVSHGAIRAQVLGLGNTAATSRDLEEMQAIAKECMEDGAFGISYGLAYLPGVFAAQEELIALSRVVSAYDGVMMVHLRSHSQRMREAIEEVVCVARESGVKLQVSHMRSYANPSFGVGALELIQLIEKAKADGVNITFDEHPYLSGSTLLSQVLPPWAKDGGAAAICKRLQDPLIRKRLREELQPEGPIYEGWDNYVGIAGWDNIVVSSVECEQNKTFLGKTLDAIALEMGVDEIDALSKLLISENARCCMVVLNLFSQEDTIELIKHPLCFICSDGIPTGIPHPRLFETFPKFLSTYVQMKGTLSWAQAIKKLTGDAAKRLGFIDRGFIKPGFKADLVVFNPDQIADHEDYSNPAQLPIGIEQVIVNGTLAVSSSQIMGSAGQVISRK